jgi:hypothetical protein
MTRGNSYQTSHSISSKKRNDNALMHHIRQYQQHVGEHPARVYCHFTNWVSWRMGTGSILTVNFHITTVELTKSGHGFRDRMRLYLVVQFCFLYSSVSCKIAIVCQLNMAVNRLNTCNPVYYFSNTCNLLNYNTYYHSAVWDPAVSHNFFENHIKQDSIDPVVTHV